ncbi:fluoride efflux transporter CrcB [Kitasatospora sp. NPDC048540]|uniref:fluoride efflux transporter CrcB n=1 Tax=Kitasatospora sp. NPDC048540 TaxID=3155634 RepID=UPI0033EBD41B
MHRRLNAPSGTHGRPPADGADVLPIDPDTAVPLPAEPAGVQRPARPRQWDVVAVVAVGGGVGSIARYTLARAWPTPVGGFPWATFTTNITGSLLLGVLMVHVLEVRPPNRYARPFLGVGLLGGFTTFSTYAVELRDLLARGHLAVADAYALTSLVVGLAAAWTGIAATRRLARPPVSGGPQRRAEADRTATTRPPSEGNR